MAAQLELAITPLVGRSYVSIEMRAKRVDAIERAFATQIPFPRDGNQDHLASGNTTLLKGSYRGGCYNPITNLFLICDFKNSCVKTFDVEILGDTDIRVIGRGHVGARGSNAGSFQGPMAVDVNTRGDIAVGDGKLNRVSFFAGNGSLLHHFGKTGSKPGEFRGLLDLKFTILGHVAVVDSDNHRVQVFTAAGSVVVVIGQSGWGLGEFASPCALDIARNGDIFVCDGGNKRIQRFSAKGKFLSTWGSSRDKQRKRKVNKNDSNGFPIEIPPIRSIFKQPTAVKVGVHGDIFVCDAERREIFVFTDAGTCLHVLSMPGTSQWRPTGLCICRNSLLVIASGSTASPSTAQSSDIDEHDECMLIAYPPAVRVPTGNLGVFSWATLLGILSFISYADAVKVRLVNRCCHRACRVLRNEWKLSPLVPGHPTITKYNKVVRKATGRAAVTEVFDQWGMRVYKPTNRIRKHVMDFESGFRSAISSLYSPMFYYQHEEVLRQIFLYHAAGDKAEIGKESFMEIATVIEEIQTGFLTWEQCAAFRDCDCIPPVRTPARVAQVNPTAPAALAPLTLVENAHEHHLDKLLLKLQSL